MTNDWELNVFCMLYWFMSWINKSRSLAHQKQTYCYHFQYVLVDIYSKCDVLLFSQASNLNYTGFGLTRAVSTDLHWLLSMLASFTVITSANGPDRNQKTFVLCCRTLSGHKPGNILVHITSRTLFFCLLPGIDLVRNGWCWCVHTYSR